MTTEETVISFQPLARSLSHRIAWVEGDQEDLEQEGMIELYRALQRTWARGITIDNLPAFAKRVMVRKMKSFYSQAVRHRPPDVEIKEGHLRHEEPEEELLGDIFLSDLLRDLEQSLGSRKRWIVETLLQTTDDPGSPKGLIRSAILAGLSRDETGILLSHHYPELDPSSPILSDLIEEETQDLREGGFLEGLRLVMDPSLESARVSHRQIREALHLSIPGWFKVLAEIRDFLSPHLREAPTPL